MKIRLLTLVLIITSTILSAQRSQNGARPTAIITGKVIEAENKTPLEFASITFRSQKDSSIVSGGMTDLEGAFDIKTRPGKLFAEIEFIGYNTKVISNIIAKPGSKKELGTIAIESGKMLDEVEIVEEKSEMKFSLDKRVFNVGKDLSSTGGNAQDLLDNIPSVTVGVEGEVELRGNSNVRILINGRPSGLVGIGDTEGLRNIPSSMIEKVEVITNPSAKFEAEGMTGIINIILKEQRKGGFNGSFELSGAYPKGYGAGANLNYRRDDINWFLNYGYRHRTGAGVGKFLQITEKENLSEVSLREFIRDRNGEKHSLRFGGEYFITPKQTITAAFLYRKGIDNNLNKVTYQDTSFTGTVPSKSRAYYSFLENESTRTDKEREDDNNQEYSLRYDNKLGKNHSLRMSIAYQSQEETESSNIDDSANQDQKSANTEGEEQIRFQIDYDKKIGKNKVETGILTSIRNVRNDFSVSDLIDSQWVPLGAFTDKFNYDENIYAAYINYGQEMGKFSYQAGLRYEYSYISTKLQSLAKPNTRKYGQLFPSAFMTYKLPAQNQLQLSYSRRISRPRFWDLNPFFTFLDNRNYFSGNPNVNPSYTNSFELGHLKYWDSINFGSTIYFRKTTDAIRRLKTYNTSNAITTSTTKPENSGFEDNYGFEFIAGYTGIKKLRIDASANFFGYHSVSEDKTIDISGESFTASLNFKYSIGRKFNFQLRNNYRAPRKTLQGKMRSILSTNLALSQDFIGDKATFTFAIQDLFNQRRRRMIIEAPGVYETMNFQWRPRTFKATLTYRINQKKQRGRRGGRPDSSYDGGGM